MNTIDLANLLVETAHSFMKAVDERNIERGSLLHATEVQWLERITPTSSTAKSERRRYVSHRTIHKLYEEFAKSDHSGLWVLHEAVKKLSQEQGKYLLWHGRSFETEGGKALLAAFFERCGGFDIDDLVARQLCHEIIEDLASDTAQVLSVYQVDGFSASSDVAVSPEVTIHKVREHDIDRFGRVNPWENWKGRPPIDREGWLCRILYRIPKDNPNEMGGFRDRCARIAAALSLTAPGRSTFQHLHTGFTSPAFAYVSYLAGGEPVLTSSIGGPIEIDNSGIANLVSRHFQLKEVADDQKLKYLRLPLHRLRLASQRTTNDDRLVDFVIALESLLANDSERGEITFRFKLRGAALLPVAEFGDAAERIALMSKLYSLRSSVVHGSASEEKVNELLSSAEKITRSVVLWYLDHKDKFSGPQNILPKLDQALVDGGSSWASICE